MVHLLKKVLRGYLALSAKITEYAIVLAVITLVTAVLVLPLWFLAQNYPMLYSRITALFMILLLGTWGIMKLARTVSAGGIWTLLIKSTVRILLLMWFLVQCYAILQPYALVRGIAIVTLFITIGLLLYAKHTHRP